MSYVGSGFHGFQSQPCGRAVQDVLEKALATLLRHPVRIRGASRTDSGVHADHQVAVFKTDRPYSPRWLEGLNALTPRELGIYTLREVPLEFDPIYHSVGKVYRYRLWHGRCYFAHAQPHVWECSAEVDLGHLQKQLTAFEGRHDFAAFCNKDSDAKSTVRRIHQVRAYRQGNLTEIWVSGEGFLKQMVRILVGTAVDVVRGQLGSVSCADLLVPGTLRCAAGMTAPAKGLSLVQVCFDSIPDVESFSPLREPTLRFFLPI